MYAILFTSRKAIEHDWSILYKSWQSGLHISHNYIPMNIMYWFAVMCKVNVYHS